jgi:hypothetical protein
MSLCYALSTAACPVTLWVGDLSTAEHYVSMLLDHSARLAMALWWAEGRCLQGALLLKRGKASRALPKYHRLGAYLHCRPLAASESA